MLRAKVALLVVAAVAAAALVPAAVSADVHAQTGQGQNETPAGQLTRRGVAGKVASTAASSFLLETQSGTVKVNKIPSTVVRKPPEGVVGFDQIHKDDRVAVLLEKVAAAEPSTIPSLLREANALHVMVIPGKATRSHVSGVVIGNAQGKVKVHKDDGSEQELEGTANASVGDEVVVIARSKGKAGGLSVAGTGSPDQVRERLEKLEGNTAGIPADVKAKIAELHQRIEQNRLTRLEALLQKAPQAAKDAIKKALDRIRQRQGALGTPVPGTPTQPGQGRGR